jgi:alpha-tubulin suppressor-like RCC1 family protein
VTQIAGGGEHTCALLSTGKVRCWGLGIDGQLGYASTSAVGDDEYPSAAGDVNVGGQVAQVVAGRDHSCALLTTGKVRCWGRGTWAPTGYGHTKSIGDDETPATAGDVNVGGTVTQLAAGWYHTCALLDTGKVRCWGFGGFGQLGYGNTDNIGDDEAPATAGDVDVGGQVKQITAGTFHTCALLTTGKVRCWGRGSRGQLGLRLTCNVGDDEKPSSVDELRLGGEVVEVSAGSYHTCALMSSGQVRCWGDGEHGRLGYGNDETIGDDEIPATAGDVPLSADTNECKGGGGLCSTGNVCVNTIGGYDCTCDVGYTESGGKCNDIDECATGTDDCDVNASCQNLNGGYTCACNAGYVGDGLVCSLQNPCVQGTHNCDADATCNLASNGFTCTCNEGFTGDGFTCTDVDECAMGSDECDANATCTNTPGGHDCTCAAGYYGDGKACHVNYVQGASAGGTHTCAVLGSGTARCWGLGYSGQLGYGNTSTIGHTSTPAAAGDINLGATPVEVVTGGAHSCALTDAGKVRCWGQGVSGQLGYGSTGNVGDNEHPSAVGDVPVGASVVQLALGGDHTCALLSTGKVRCWGSAQLGQLGYGNTKNIGDNETPASAGDVLVGGTVTQITAGKEHTCALLSGGNVRCWGNGQNGRLGYGNQNSIGDDESPAAAGDVPVGGTVAQISAGYAHTCAVLVTGKVRCWGLGQTGQLGYGNINNIGDNESPASAGDVNVGAAVVKVSAGMHTCALLTTGKIRCWGSGTYGRLGYGDSLTIGDNEDPAAAGDVVVGGKAVDVTVDVMHSCAVLETGTLRCWGFGSNGQLGYGNQLNIGDNEDPSAAGDVPVT